MLGFVVSTIVYFVVQFFLSRYLDDQGLEKCASRSLLVFLVASIVSFGVGYLLP